MQIIIINYGKTIAVKTPVVVSSPLKSVYSNKLHIITVQDAPF